MFDIAFTEVLVIVIVAVLVIGPKDLPMAMRTAGRWIGRVRKVSAHFRTGIDAMVREAEMEDMEKKWKAQNEEIMRRTADSTEAAAGEPLMTGPPPISAEDAAEVASKPAPNPAADSVAEPVDKPNPEKPSE